jgi:hypothetical protein
MRGGRAAATVFSLAESCRLAGVDLSNGWRLVAGD